MGLFDGFYKAIARRVEAYANMPTTGYTAVQYGRANYKGTDDETLIKEGYLKNADIYSIIQMDVRKFASIPVNTYKVKADDRKAFEKYRRVKRYMGAATMVMQRKALEEIAEDNDISRLLQRPNPWQGADQFWQMARGFYDMTGEAFIWKARATEGGPPVALYVLPTQYITVIGSSTNMYQPAKFIFTINGQEIQLDPADVIHWKTWTPEFDLFTRPQLRGVSPLQALARSMTASNEANDAMVAMFQNGGAKGVLYNETYNDLSPEQESQLRGVIDRKINNSKMKAAVASLQGKWGYQDLGLNSVDMQLLESMKVTRKQFADAIGIPVDLIEGDKTYANREQAMKDWVSNTLYPAWKSLTDELNRALVPEFGTSMARVVIDVDISMLPEMQDDMKMLTEIAEKSWWLDWNEKRVLTGNEPDPGKAGLFFLPAGLQTLEQAMAEVAPPMTDQQITDLSKLYEYR